MLHDVVTFPIEFSDVSMRNWLLKSVVKAMLGRGNPLYLALRMDCLLSKWFSGGGLLLKKVSDRIMEASLSNSSPSIGSADPH